ILHTRFPPRPSTGFIRAPPPRQDGDALPQRNYIPNLSFKQRLDVHFGQEGNADKRTAPSVRTKNGSVSIGYSASRRLSTESISFSVSQFWGIGSKLLERFSLWPLP